MLVPPRVMPKIMTVSLSPRFVASLSNKDKHVSGM